MNNFKIHPFLVNNHITIRKNARPRIAAIGFLIITKVHLGGSIGSAQPGQPVEHHAV